MIFEDRLDFLVSIKTDLASRTSFRLKDDNEITYTLASHAAFNGRTEDLSLEVLNRLYRSQDALVVAKAGLEKMKIVAAKAQG
jgi:hypothetical protein